MQPQKHAASSFLTQSHEFRSIILHNSLYRGSPGALNIEPAIKASYLFKGISWQLSWVPQGDTCLGVSQHSTKIYCRDAEASNMAQPAPQLGANSQNPDVIKAVYFWAEGRSTMSQVLGSVFIQLQANILKVKVKRRNICYLLPSPPCGNISALYWKLCKPLHDFLQSNRFK